MHSSLGNKSKTPFQKKRKILLVINNPVRKRAKDMNRYFPEEVIQMAIKHVKRCSLSLVIREMQIKTTMRYRLTPARMAIIFKNQKIIDVGVDVVKREHFYTVGGNVN